MNNTITLTDSSPSIQHLCKRDKRLAKIIGMIGDISYKPCDDPFKFLVHEIIEQMLSVKAGRKIYSRLEEMCNGAITPETINNFSANEIQAIGTSSAKAQYIKDLANSVVHKDLVFETLDSLPDKEVIKELTKLRGIGEWTAHMYLIFVLDRQDILPTTDVAFLQVYEWLYKTDDRSKTSVEKKCKKWKPYSSIATRYFYHALDEGYTKEEFHLFK